MLSRINDVPEIISASQHGVDSDTAWNTSIELHIIPDPRLSAFQKEMLTRDYCMVNGVLKISTQAALATYYLQYLRIDQINPSRSPEAQQLILENFTAIKQWLF